MNNEFLQGEYAKIVRELQCRELIQVTNQMMDEGII